MQNFRMKEKICTFWLGRFIASINQSGWDLLTGNTETVCRWEPDRWTTTSQLGYVDNGEYSSTWICEYFHQKIFSSPNLGLPSLDLYLPKTSCLLSFLITTLPFRNWVLSDNSATGGRHTNFHRRPSPLAPP